MVDNLPGNALMLVGILPSRKDYEIARLLGWYRIPLRMAPKIIDVDYLAFYQTGAFGADHRWRIETFAEVRGHELTTRKELLRDEPDHPRAAEEYFKVQIGDLHSRPEPILTEKWKRITFLYTTGELFNQARIVNDLVVRSYERETLWKSLRERAAISGTYAQTKRENNFPIDAAILKLFGSLPDFDNSDTDSLEI